MYPHELDAELNVPSSKKRRLGWPAKPDCVDKNGKLQKGALLPDKGILPCDVPEPKTNLSDTQHRIRGIGSAFHEMVGGKTVHKTDTKLDVGEAENAKHSAGYYIKGNQHWNDEDYETKAPCMSCHLFNNHSLCDASWCTHLQAENETDPAKKAKLMRNNKRKFHNTETEEEKELHERVKAKVVPLLTPKKMRQVHHRFQTQKNETLQRKTMSLLPKDSLFGRTMQLHDGIRLCVILDSLGEHEGSQRLFWSLGLPGLHTCMGLWADRKDKEDGQAAVRRRLPEVKLKSEGTRWHCQDEGTKHER